MGQGQSRIERARAWRELRFGEVGVQDPFAIDRLDDREDYGEERYVVIGRADGNILLFVAYTEREDRMRIISARRATQYEQDDYFQQTA